MAPERLRLFVAVLLPDEVRRRVATITGRLHDMRTHVSIVREENLHVTLKFLGETDAGLVGKIASVIGGVAAAHTTFDAEVAGWGAFPNPRKARVLWAGISCGAGELRQLSRDVEKELVKVGFQDENRFKAHITVGRVRKPDISGALEAALGEDVGSLGSFRVNDIHLMNSELSQGGSKYESLGAFALNVGPPASL